MSKLRNRTWGWVVLLLVCAGVLSFGLQQHQSTQKTPQAATRRSPTGPVSVTTAAAKKGNIGVYLDAIGTVTPVYTTSITPQANGMVIAVNYTEGQMVKKGDPLIDIDPRFYQAQVLEAQGALDRDTNLLAQSKMDLERFRQAWARNAIQKQMLDDQEKLVLQQQGTVKNDQGALELALVQLDYCHITAPISGRIGLRLLDPGNVVQANVTSATTSALVVITQIQPITVIFTIPEDHVGQVWAQRGNGAALPVEVFDRAQEKKIATGKLLTLDNQIDTTTGTVKLRALFDNKDQALFPNQFVNARLLVRTLKGVTLIPANAIQRGGQGTFVYVIKDGEAHIQNVKPGVEDSGTTAVDGIHPGDIVATSSFDKLQNGVKVAAVTQSAPAEASGSMSP